MENDEILIRLAFRPDQIDDAGSLKPTAINKLDLKRQVEDAPPARGCSVNRDAHVDPAFLVAKAQKFHRDNPVMREEVWEFVAPVETVRALVAGDGHRAVCVVDRALADDPSHAEVWGAVTGRGGGALSDLRDQLAAVLRRRKRIV